MLLLHQIVPHWHHQHKNDRHETVHHDDKVHDHHHEKPEGKDSNRGFFDFFLELHTHTNETTNVLVLEQSSVQKISDQKAQVKTFGVTKINVPLFDDTVHDKIWHHPPNKQQKAHFPNLSLRGPPVLG